MRATSIATAIGAALIILTGLGGAAQADDSAKAPTTGSTKPNMGAGPDQKSVQSGAAPATTTASTGAKDQSGTVKSMNNSAKAQVETGGK